MTGAEHEPLSWLTLERYALGELGAERCAHVERALARSERVSAALASVRAQVELLPLPVVERPRRLPRRAGLTASVLFAAAAALSLALLRLDRLPPVRRQLKGGELVLEVVGEQAGAGARHFAQHERFKLLVTCPPDLVGRLRAAVYQGDALFVPLDDGGPGACGNRSPWPGAFALDGELAAHVCVRTDGRAWPVSREALPGDVVCVTLQPRP
jgi:hypothetical protein